MSPTSFQVMLWCIKEEIVPNFGKKGKNRTWPLATYHRSCFHILKFLFVAAVEETVLRVLKRHWIFLHHDTETHFKVWLEFLTSGDKSANTKTETKKFNLRKPSLSRSPILKGKACKGFPNAFPNSNISYYSILF